MQFDSTAISIITFAYVRIFILLMPPSRDRVYVSYIFRFELAAIGKRRPMNSQGSCTPFFLARTSSGSTYLHGPGTTNFALATTISAAAPPIHSLFPMLF